LKIRTYSARILPQREEALPVRHQDLADVGGGKRAEPREVVRCLDDDLVRPDPVDAVVDPLPDRLHLAVQVECRELVRHHADTPGTVLRAARAVQLGRCPVLMAGAERASLPPARRHRLGREVHRASRPLRRDDDPALDHRVLAELRHRRLP
jgi:hypothetical protein